MNQYIVNYFNLAKSERVSETPYPYTLCTTLLRITVQPGKVAFLPVFLTTQKAEAETSFSCAQEFKDSLGNTARPGLKRTEHKESLLLSILTQDPLRVLMKKLKAIGFA